MISIHLDPTIEKRLDHLIKKTGGTRDTFALKAILDHLEELEDIYLATSRVEEPAPTYSAEEVKIELGL